MASSLSRILFKSILKNLSRGKDLKNVLKDSVELFNKNIIGNWVCPDNQKTIDTKKCKQMNPRDQLLWNEYTKGNQPKKLNKVTKTIR